MRASHPAAPYPAAEWRSPFGAAVRRWRRLSPLARDVTVVLAIKAMVLGLLWFAFFRTPAAAHMTMDPQRVEYRVLAPSPAPEAKEPDAVP